MNFTLRKWTISDIDSLLRHASNKAVTNFMSDGFPKTEQAWNRFIEFANNNESIIYRAIDVNGKAIGGIGVSQKDDIMKKNAELGYWLSSDYWGKGIMTRAICEMVKITFETFNIERIYAKPFGTNSASHRVLEKSGFTLEAKFEKIIYKNGKYLDELVYGIRRTQINAIPTIIEHK